MELLQRKQKKREKRNSNILRLTGWFFRFFKKKLFKIVGMMFVVELYLLFYSIHEEGAQSLDYYIKNCHIGTVFFVGLALAVVFLIKFHQDANRGSLPYMCIQNIPMDPAGYCKAMSLYLFMVTLAGMLLQMLYLFICYMLCGFMHLKNGFFLSCYRGGFSTWLFSMNAISFLVMFSIMAFICFGVPALLVWDYQWKESRLVAWGVCILTVGVAALILLLPYEDSEFMDNWIFTHPGLYNFLMDKGTLVSLILLFFSSILFFHTLAMYHEKGEKKQVVHLGISEESGRKSRTGKWLLVLLVSYIAIWGIMRIRSTINLMEIVNESGDERVLENFDIQVEVEEQEQEQKENNYEFYSAFMTHGYNSSDYLNHKGGIERTEEKTILKMECISNTKVKLLEGKEFPDEEDKDQFLFDFSKKEEVQQYKAVRFAGRIIVLGWNSKTEDLVIDVFQDNGTFVKETYIPPIVYATGTAENLIKQYKTFGNLMEEESMGKYLDAISYQDKVLCFVADGGTTRVGIYNLFLSLGEDGTVTHLGHLAYKDWSDYNDKSMAFTERYICLLNEVYSERETEGIINQQTLDNVRMEKDKAATILVYEMQRGNIKQVYSGYINSNGADDWYTRNYTAKHGWNTKKSSMVRECDFFVKTKEE